MSAPLPFLEQPSAGDLCPRCQHQLEFVDWCRCGWPADGIFGENPDYAAYAAGISAEASLVQEGREQTVRLFHRACSNCGRTRHMKDLSDDGWCSTCTDASRARLAKLPPLAADVIARERAAVTGQVLVLSLHDETWDIDNMYRMARRVAGYALDALGRE